MAWWKNAQAGDKVVCISVDEANLFKEIFPDFRHPYVGEVVVVESVHIDIGLPWFRAAGYGCQFFLGDEVFLYCPAFAPAHQNSMDAAMSSLRSHLIPAKKLEDA